MKYQSILLSILVFLGISVTSAFAAESISQTNFHSHWNSLTFEDKTVIVILSSEKCLNKLKSFGELGGTAEDCTSFQVIGAEFRKDLSILQESGRSLTSAEQFYLDTYGDILKELHRTISELN